jgi:MYXO-CTERM domain-containing protein
MRTAFAVIGAVGLLAGSASAQVFSFNFQNLDSTYTTTGGYSARAANAPTAVASYGGVSTNIGTPIATNFGLPGAGFVGLGAADYVMDLSVTNILGNIASGFGSFTITDFDGDTITGTISGDRTVGAGTLGWRQAGIAVAFFGELTNVQFNQRPGGTDTLWNGPNGGSFDWTTLPGGPAYFGNIVQLTFNTFGGGLTPFHEFNWGSGVAGSSAVPSGLNATLIPAPGAAALLGLGGLLAARRRR